MSQTDSRNTSAERAPGVTAVRDPERLPPLIYLWLPLLAAVALLVAAHTDLRFYEIYIGSEIGVLEISQVLIPLGSALVCLRILALPQARRDRLVVIWIGLAFLGSIYLAGEEASWGQHYVGWMTPEGWQALNDQGETNLHNTSSWFDQKPRALLEVGVIVGGIIIPLIALYRPGLRQGRFGVFLPPLVCLPVALLAEVSKFWERLQGAGLLDVMLFYRASEVQELYFVLFILFYLLVFRKRLLAGATAARASTG